MLLYLLDALARLAEHVLCRLPVRFVVLDEQQLTFSGVADAVLRIVAVNDSDVFSSDVVEVVGQQHSDGGLADAALLRSDGHIQLFCLFFTHVFISLC